MKETLCLISNCVLNRVLNRVLSRVDLYKEYEVEKVYIKYFLCLNKLWYQTFVSFFSS